MSFARIIGTGSYVPDRVITNAELERRQLCPEVGPTSAFYRCVPTGVRGPACTFWATLKTAFAAK